MYKPPTSVTALAARSRIRLIARTSASDSRDGDCLDSLGAVCGLMFKKPRSLYEVTLMAVAGSLFVVLLLKAAFALGFG
jgi:hypothetical protein